MSAVEPHFRTSALLVIDMQNDFVLQESTAEIPGTAEITSNVDKLLRGYRSAGLPIIHIVRLYLPDGSNVDLCRKEMISAGKSIVVPGSTGSEIVTSLRPEPGLELDHARLLAGEVQKWGDIEFVIYKPRWGAFFATALEKLLGDVGSDTVVVCGCNFPNCPRTTIYEASERDFRVVFVADATSGTYGRGEEELDRIGVRVRTTEEVLSSL